MRLPETNKILLARKYAFTIRFVGSRQICPIDRKPLQPSIYHQKTRRGQRRCRKLLSQSSKHAKVSRGEPLAVLHPSVSSARTEGEEGMGSKRSNSAYSYSCAPRRNRQRASSALFFSAGHPGPRLSRLWNSLNNAARHHFSSSPRHERCHGTGHACICRCGIGVIVGDGACCAQTSRLTLVHAAGGRTEQPVLRLSRVRDSARMVEVSVSCDSHQAPNTVSRRCLPLC